MASRAPRPYRTPEGPFAPQTAARARRLSGSRVGSRRFVAGLAVGLGSLLLALSGLIAETPVAPGVTSGDQQASCAATSGCATPGHDHEVVLVQARGLQSGSTAPGSAGTESAGLEAAGLDTDGQTDSALAVVGQADGSSVAEFGGAASAPEPMVVVDAGEHFVGRTLRRRQDSQQLALRQRLAEEQRRLAEARAKLVAARSPSPSDGLDPAGRRGAVTSARDGVQRADRRVSRIATKLASVAAAMNALAAPAQGHVTAASSSTSPGSGSASGKASQAFASLVADDQIDPPTLSVMSDAAGALLYDWTVVADASHYTLYVDLEPEVDTVTGTPFPTEDTALLIDNVPPGTTVYAMVTATVAEVETRGSNEVRIVTPTTPAAPQGFQAQATNSASVILSWQSADDVDHYRIFWSETPGVLPWTGNLIGSVTSPHTHAGLAPGRTYHYIVVGVNELGLGEPSEELAVTVLEPTTQGNEGSPLGVNLHAITYWSPEWVFKDVFKQSKPWYPQEANSGAWDTDFPLNLTADGYPILGTNPAGNPEAAGTLMFRDLDGHYPSGEYICLYDGVGEVELGMDATVVSSQPGRIVCRVDDPSDSGIFLKIRTTPNPSNPVRNIRLFHSQWENSYLTEPFHPAFLARIAAFKMIRFMDWQRTNHNDFLMDWEDRARASFQTQASPERGVALEHMIQLSNTLGADPWFCMPHLATDDYVVQFAIQCRNQLRPDLQIYIEHSNEVWNGAFGQAQYALQTGKARGLSDNDFQAQLRYHSQRSVQIFEIFEQVFGGTDRLVRVLGSQSDNPWVGTTVMDWDDAYQHADALAVAPYWDGGLTGNIGVLNMSMSQIMDILADDIDETRSISEQNAANAAARGLTLIAYEGGQHLTPKPQYVDNPAMAQKFIEINRHPGMYDLYVRDLEHWADVGGGMYAIFSSMSVYSKWGSWGIMEYEDQDPATAPKYQACLQFIADQASVN